MTGALLVGAVALILWPERRTVTRLHPGVAAAAAHRSVPAAVAVPVLAVAGVAVVSTPLVAALAGAAALAAVRLLAARRATARVDAGLRGLADGLGALAAELRSGRSLEPAATAAADACGDREVGRSLLRAVRTPEVPPPELPAELRDALVRIAAATRLSARTGCSLAAVATAVEDDLRARAGHRADLRAATAGPRASAAVLAGLPLLGLLMGSGVGADPWAVLTTTGAGQVLLVVGVALEVAGLAWSHRLVQRALG